MLQAVCVRVSVVYMCGSLNYLVENCKNENSSIGILVSLCDDGCCFSSSF